MTDLRARLALAQTAVRWAQTSEQRERAMLEVEELKAKMKQQQNNVEVEE